MPVFNATGMSRALFLITTFNRPWMCERVLGAIPAGSGAVVLNDASKMDYSRVKSICRQRGYTYIRPDRNGGRKGYWKTISYAYMIAQGQKGRFDYFVQVPDDVYLPEGWYEKATAIHRELPRHSVLNLINDGRKPHHSTQTDNTVHSGWVDMCYICAWEDFKKILPIPKAHPSDYGSGVGNALSQRLGHLSIGMHMVKESIAIHGNARSAMNPEERELHPLVSGREPIVASMATMPGREPYLAEAVASLLPQVDRVNVYLNNFVEVPPGLDDEKVHAVLGRDALGDLGDAGKFYWADVVTGYHLTVDDDIIYPPDYAKRMIEAVDAYKRKAIICAHGQTKNDRVHSYYHDYVQSYPVHRGPERDVPMMVPGTGATAYHYEVGRIDLNAFPVRNMADIWLAIWAQRHNVAVIRIKSGKDWPCMNRKFDHGETTIYHQYAGKNKDALQTEIWNASDWKVLPPPV